MKSRTSGSTQVLKHMSRLILMIPLLQLAGCTTSNITTTLLQGFIQSVALQVFIASQTVFTNLFGV